MAKIFIKTFGCSANYNNSEIMEGLLIKAGHYVVKEPKDSDLIIVNTCTVKLPTENKVKNNIRDFLKLNKKIIVAGCMPEVQKDTLKKISPQLSFVGVYHTKEITKAVDKVINRYFVDLTGKRDETKLNLPVKRKNKIIQIIQISEGCNGICTYCIVRLAKGKLFSYPEKDIVKQVRSAVKDGCGEIWLTSQDTAAYGQDKNIDLVSLLRKIVLIKEDFMVRIGMMDPNNLILILDDLITLMKSEKIFKFLHIPIQSGNNEILKKMKRPYNTNQFKKIIKKLRKEIPEITISTDMICGFPGETEEQFNDSIKLIKEIKPDVLNISRFWPRPGTEAALMKNRVHGRITKKRSQILTREFNKICTKRNKKWLKWQGDILVDEKGQKGSFIGRNYCYKPVVIKSENNLIGKNVNVKITKATNHTLYGIRI
ncbi:MAG: tRNA (N(6)-L-threonylcarbamoyladenosine(37)-C(2))-methylthiotransferase [Candidatus Nanoarchaeia archaeon]|nr:tRNA (N(6)-L-threonylcarbamoyladenosine(37)-C(2))-methylthiotransferase [Candidatus Nanoarchaeia archaeon]